MPGTIRALIGRAPPTNGREWARLFGNLPTEHIKSGQTDYDTGTGFFLGDHNGTPKFSLGNSAANKVTWDGSTLTIVGTITATTGTIGGWTLAATYLSSGTGATTVRLDSAGTNPAISAGHATPGSAPFRVTQAGALFASNATITGAITATSGSFTGSITAQSGSFTGGVTIGTGGSFSSGQSAYNTGTGFWIEHNSGTPRLSIGTAGGNGITWNGSTLAITGTLTFANSAQTFTPTWNGFSADPSGDISYLDFGAYVVMFIGAQLSGTSNATSMSITNLPAGIQPASARNIANCPLVDNGAISHVGGADINGATMTFGLLVTDLVANRVNRSNTAFTGSGDKGLAAGWLVTYPK